MDWSFYKDKTVFLTGHTGFKGSWMSKILAMLGAKVIGYSLEAPTNPNLYELSEINKGIVTYQGDIRDRESLQCAMQKYSPEVVIHMAAQPIVREGYRNPVYTYETNVMGTVHICEAIRRCDSVKSFVNVTTDKVYENKEWEWGYRENDILNGFDPYSNSKSCSELVTNAYYNSYFHTKGIAVSTCRAGNVIGGGDFAQDRIVPDCVRAMEKGETIFVRNPNSTRPYQHVLEPLFAYLLVAKEQFGNITVAGAYNVGPDECDCVTTGKLVSLFTEIWGEGAAWTGGLEKDALHEAGVLKLDSSRMKKVFQWAPHWHIKEAVEKTVEWSKEYLSGGNVVKCMEQQILQYMEE